MPPKPVAMPSPLPIGKMYSQAMWSPQVWKILWPFAVLVVIAGAARLALEIWSARRRREQRIQEQVEANLRTDVIREARRSG